VSAQHIASIELGCQTYEVNETFRLLNPPQGRFNSATGVDPVQTPTMDQQSSYVSILNSRLLAFVHSIPEAQPGATILDIETDSIPYV